MAFTHAKVQTCLFICLGDFRVSKFHEETSDIGCSRIARSRRYWICPGAWSILQMPPFLAASPLHGTLSVLETWHLQKQKSKFKVAFIPPPPLNMLIYTKYNDIRSRSTLWRLDLNGGEAAAAAQASTAFRRSLEARLDFWSCTQYHLVMGMVKNSSVSLCCHVVVLFGLFVKTSIFSCACFYEFILNSLTDVLRGLICRPVLFSHGAAGGGHLNLLFYFSI